MIESSFGAYRLKNARVGGIEAHIYCSVRSLSITSSKRTELTRPVYISTAPLMYAGYASHVKSGRLVSAIMDE